MFRARFRRLVARALDAIPDELADRMDNVEVVVRTRPTVSEHDAEGLPRNEILLGLYEGQPLTTRDSGYGSALPDRIFIFQEAIEQVCRSDEEVVAQVRKTVLHEVAHHFGIDDERLNELGLD